MLHTYIAITMMTSRRSIAVSPMVVCRRERSSCWPSGNAGCSSRRLTKGSVPYQKILSAAADWKSQITRVIMGKHKPIYDPSFVVGDFVVVINADKSATLTLMCSFACSIAHMPLIPIHPLTLLFQGQADRPQDGPEALHLPHGLPRRPRAGAARSCKRAKWAAGRQRRAISTRTSALTAHWL